MADVDPEHNAFTMPRIIGQDCTHQFRCKCSVPFHLRESTASEQRFIARVFAPPEIEYEPDSSATDET